jgi:hypothetical protein
MCQPDARIMPPACSILAFVRIRSHLRLIVGLLQKLRKRTIRLGRPLRQSPVSIGTAKIGECIEARQQIGAGTHFNRRGLCRNSALLEVLVRLV